jgi:hypothetical protein
MILLKKILSLVLLVVFSSFTNCKKSNDDSREKIVRTNAQSIPSDKDIKKEPIPVTGSIIKKPVKQRTSKRVKFADQVLDDSIGTEPLDSKYIEIKSTGGKEVKQKPKVAKNNSASHSESSLAFILICSALAVCLNIPFDY